MKKKLLVLGSMLMLLVSPAKALEDMEFGLRTLPHMTFTSGLSESTRYGENRTEAGPAFWGKGGLFFAYRFNEYVGIDTSLLGIGTVATLKEKENANKSFSIFSWGLALPVLAEIFPMGYDEDAPVNFSVVLGPQLILPLIASAENVDGGEPTKTDVKSHYSSFEVNAIGGLNVKFPFGLAIEAAYGFGFMDMLNSSAEDTKKFKKGDLGIKEDTALTNQYVSLGLSFSFAPYI